MPDGDGTGPRSTGQGLGRGTGRGMGIGGGRGLGRQLNNAGPSGMCKCPKCGYKEPHVRAKPCMSLKCPKCGTTMIRSQD